MNHVLHTIRRVTVEATQTDGQLLEAYSERRDGAAFAELVRRHGPMVWGVCRRMLPNRQDAEDAFQVTFLVLVRKSASVRPAERVGNWLHGVAVRAAQKAAAAVRRRERPVEDVPDPTVVVESGIWRDVLPILDEELRLLPERYRSVIVLCDLEQMTRSAAARQLGVPEGTVAGWLARARAMLGKRLARRGVGAPALAAVISEQIVSAVVPPPVVRVLLETANRAGPIPVGVATLTEGVIRTMSFNKIKVTAAALLVGLGVMASGAVLLTRPTAAAQPPLTEATSSEKGRTAERPANGLTVSYARVDRNSEPSAERYRALFGKTLAVLAEHFEVIVSANAYEGRIEARQPFGKRTVFVEIRVADGGGYLVQVQVLREAPEGKPASQDFDLERGILRRLAPQTEIRSGEQAIPTVCTGAMVSSSPPQTEARPDQTIPSRLQKPVEPEDDQVRRLQKEVDELRERVRALERKLSNREKSIPNPITVRGR